MNADTDELMEKFGEERGQGDRATEGPGDTLSALAMGAVDVLLVAPDDPDDARTAWFGPDPTQLAATRMTCPVWGWTSRSRAVWSTWPFAPRWALAQGYG